MASIAVAGWSHNIHGVLHTIRSEILKRKGGTRVVSPRLSFTSTRTVAGRIQWEAGGMRKNSRQRSSQPTETISFEND